MKSIKTQYIDLKEGKMTQAQFMRNIRMSLPQYVTNVTSFNDTVKILRNKAILTEADIYGIAGDPEAEAERRAASMSIKPARTPEEKYGVDKKIDQYKLDFLKKLYAKNPTDKLKQDIDDLENRMNLNESLDAKYVSNEEYKYAVKSKYIIGMSSKEDILYFKSEQEAKDYISQKPSSREYIGIQNKQINESYTTNTSGKELYSKFAEIDNLNGQEVLIGIDYEIEKNNDLTKKEATKIVIKNLKKNQFYYTDTLISGVEGAKAEYMNKIKPGSDQMKDVKSNDLVDKTNGMTSPKGIEKTKASANKARKETNKVESGIKMMSLVAKTVRGIKKMDATGEKMKKLALKENQDVDLNTLNSMLNNHDWYYRMSDDERVYDAGKAMEDKLQMLARKLGQEGIDAYNDVQLKMFPKSIPLTLEKTSSTFEKIKSNKPSNPKLDALIDKISKMAMKEYSTMPGGDNMTDVAGYQIDEAKASSLSVGNKFKMNANLGKFVKDEEVEVISLEPFGNDIRLVLSNGKDEDDFYL
jgi:hypothetical protein